MVILSKELIENFAYAIDCLGLEDHIIWRVIFWEILSAKSSYGGRDKELTIVISGDVHGIGCSCDIYVVSHLWMFFSQGRQNGSQVQNVIDVVFLNNLLVSLLVGDIHLVVFAINTIAGFNQIRSYYL